MKDYSITGTTRLVGLVGYPVEHSFSPVMHNAAFRSLNMNYVYLPFPVARGHLQSAVRGLFCAGVSGLNVTVPYKEQVIEYLDEVDDYARAVGAVNTIVSKEGKLVGYNTDGPGFISSLTGQGFDVRGRKFVLLGAGGSARAVAFALAKAGAGGICIVNRTVARAEQLVKEIGVWVDAQAMGLDHGALGREIENSHWLINTTSVGMFPNTHQLPLDAQLVRPGIGVVDLIYNPLRTKLLIEAQRQGLAALNGMEMLVYQGAASFSLWTGVEGPVDVMKQAIMQA